MTKYLRVKHVFSAAEWAENQANLPDSYHFPAIAAHHATPLGGDNRVKYNQAWWGYLKAINTPEAFEALRRNNAGLFNFAANPEWEQGTPVDVGARAEGITTSGNVHIYLDVKNGAAELITMNYFGGPPDPNVVNPKTHPHLFVRFTSSNKLGDLGNSPDGVESYFPLVAKENAYLTLDKVELIDSYDPIFPGQQEQDMSIELRPHGLSGKGMYLWNIERVENGNPERIAQVAKSAGLTHVLIKIANGPYAYNGDLAVPTANALNDIGIQAWGWQYIYGINPAQEAEQAMMQIQETGVRGFVVNAEVQFKGDGMDKAARTYMNLLRQGTNVPIGFSSYKYPSYHREVPWDVFLQYSDVWMPQVYWMDNYSPERPEIELKRSYDDFARLGVPRPFFPTGAAFKEHGWQSSPEQVTAFLEAVDAMGLDGANFWEWANARDHKGQTIELEDGTIIPPYPKGAMWDAISRYGRARPPQWGEPDYLRRLKDYYLGLLK